MKVCYITEDVPESELQNVIDAMAVDNCSAKVEKRANGNYDVTAICDEEDSAEEDEEQNG